MSEKKHNKGSFVFELFPLCTVRELSGPCRKGGNQEATTIFFLKNKNLHICRPWYTVFVHRLFIFYLLLEFCFHSKDRLYWYDHHHHQFLFSRETNIEKKAHMLTDTHCTLLVCFSISGKEELTHSRQGTKKNLLLLVYCRHKHETK